MDLCYSGDIKKKAARNLKNQPKQEKYGSSGLIFA
jgi:hypothetical protein